MKQLLLFSLIAILVGTAEAGRIGRFGGISGGGGGTVEANAVGRYTIESMLQHPGRLPVFLLFNSHLLESKLAQLSAPNGNDIIEVLQQVKIHINSETPCYDSEGVEKDGSVYSPVENTICISSFTLGKKLTDDNAFAQTMALVAHEYSHLVGANEEEADEIQRSALQELNSRSVYRDGFNEMNKFIDKWIEFRSHVPRTPPEGDKNAYLKSALEFVNFGGVVHDVVRLAQDHFYFSRPVLSQQHRDKLDVLIAKWEIIRRGVAVYNWGSMHGSDEDYNRGFGSSTEVKVTDFERTQRFPFFSSRLLKSSDVTVKKIQSKEDVIAAWEELHNDLQSLIEEIKAVHSQILL